MSPTRAEARRAEAIFAALFPAEAGLPGAAALPMGAFYADLLRASPPAVALGYRALVLALWLLPPLFLGTPRTFGGLSEAEREEYLGRWAKSRLYAVRQMVTLLKMLAGVGYLGFPETQRALGADYPDAVPPVDA